MNKYAITGIVLVALVGGGFMFNYYADNFSCDPSIGKDLEFTIFAKRLEWLFEPEEITVEQCDRVTVTVINEDNFDHGFAIDAFGVSQRLPANGTIVVNFVATKGGTFPFYCSVSCSDSSDTSFKLEDGVVQTGKYRGQFRGHFEQIGQFVVNFLTSENTLDEHTHGVDDDHHE